jgi:hypothetical protein
METKALKKLKEELEYWKYYESVNNMGKWSKQVRVDKLKEQIENLETLTGFAAQFYSGSDENEKLIFTEGFVEAVRVMGSLEQNEVTEDSSGSYDDLFKKKGIAHKN